MDNKTILEFFKNKKKVIIIGVVVLIAILILCIAVPKIQKKQQRKELEDKYHAKIEKCIASCKESTAQDIENRYGEKYSDLSFDIRYSLIVSDSGEISLIYYIDGDEILETYSSRCQKWACNGFWDLFYEVGSDIQGKIYINDTLHVNFDSLTEEAEEAQEARRNTCNYYDCYERITRSSGYCSFHDTPLWKELNE